MAAIDRGRRSHRLQQATAHRLRRGEIEGVRRLPAVQVGKRKWVVLKASLEQWQRENERISAA